MNIMPCLHDRFEEGGETKSEYFWQDLLVARDIFEKMPEKHVDIGSRIDGFVSNVASFREIEVFDVRPITTEIPGVTFRQMDLMNPPEFSFSNNGYCDSLSCLHAIEHFGLGRYGDPLDPNGYKRGLENMALLLKPGGTFYLSTPIGQERVEFNAHRVFDPNIIVSLTKKNGLSLEHLNLINPNGTISDIPPNADELFKLSKLSYSLGIFTFKKHPD